MNVAVLPETLAHGVPVADAPPGRTRAPLADYQEEARDAIVQVALDTLAKVRAAPDRRREIALAQGVILLGAPTGSGKTMTVSRSIEHLVGATLRPTVWFWWTPFSGLVEQTRGAFQSHSPTLRMRDLMTDRNPSDTKDGDVFVSTWASVSSRNRTLSARKSSETGPSLDLLLEWLRIEGWNIGCVIDEAHLNFGMSAKEAAAFYLDVLRPDVTVLCTATPRDDELRQFSKAAGIGKVNKVEIGRERVVDAGLNKVGVKAVSLRAAPEDAAIIDLGEAALLEGLRRHRIIKAELAAQGIPLVPLMLVQVENAAGDDPVERVIEFLAGQDVPRDAIAKHTSGEPDPHFHALAYDETREVLVFKVSAATGFDAPRAWTLVSLRKTLGRHFGLQVLGRIVRVHGRVRHLHPRICGRTEPSILDYGYAFLATPEHQPGIVEAAANMRAFHDEVTTVTDTVTVYAATGGNMAVVHADGGFVDLLAPPSRPNLDDDLPMTGLRYHALASPLQRALDLGTIQTAAAALDRGRDGFVLRAEPPRDPGQSVRERKRYGLRNDVKFPRAFAREVMPEKVDALVASIARRFDFDAEALALVHRVEGKVQVTEEDLFDPGVAPQRRSAPVPLSPEKIAWHAQMSFRFNDYLDDRELRFLLADRLRDRLERGGFRTLKEPDLRRAVDLVVMARPELLHDACRSSLAEHSVILQNEPIPDVIESDVDLPPAHLNVYRVFPPGMNREEEAFARRIDDDPTGTVVWWTRNVANARWAVSIVLPNGRLHYPDFVIGVDARRKSDDHVALVEIKDDGQDGRLFSEGNTEKVRTEHRRYGTALMLFRDGRGRWTRAEYRADAGRLVHGNFFEMEDLIRIRG